MDRLGKGQPVSITHALKAHRKRNLEIMLMRKLSVAYTANDKRSVHMALN